MIKMNRHDKIISCFGKINANSTARILGVTNEYVHNTWNRKGLFYENKNPQRLK